ncbi:keratin, type I cytoskeletal 10-like [Penaeus chinensis]|uniref:keratin, type I cytoskeletal 10-like n=1 Tax=Penaeus chinensis TaxID=139456 RepID=UPI001FB81BE0|nr:keratin, type I cytoskeletal 10-like [Penaeus chinensis]
MKFVLVVLLIGVLALGVRARPDVSSFSSSSFGGHTSSSSSFVGHNSPGGSGGGGYRPSASTSAGGYGSSRGSASGTATINFNLGASKGGSRDGNGYGK